MTPEHQECGDRRTYDRIAVIFGKSQELGIGAPDAVGETREEIGRRSGGADALHRLDHRRAGEPAVLVAPHAVGDEPDTAVGTDEMIVFIDLAHLADMSCAAGLELERLMNDHCAIPTNLPVRNELK